MFANLRERSRKGEYVCTIIESMILTRTQESSRRENRPASSNRDQNEATTTEDAKGKGVDSAILTGTQESSEDGSFANRKEGKWIVIDGQENVIRSVAFLAGGKHVLSGGGQGKIRRWRIENGEEVGTPMNAGSHVLDIAVSQDGKWVVSGTRSGSVTVWNAESHSKVTEMKEHSRRVCAVDVSPDGTRIATGSNDDTLRLVTLHRQAAARPLGTRQLGGRGQVFTRWTPHCRYYMAP